MNTQILLDKIANRINGGLISNAVKKCIEENQHEECLKMLKSMTFDNEKLMIRSYGKMLVNQIKSA